MRRRSAKPKGVSKRMVSNGKYLIFRTAHFGARLFWYLSGCLFSSTQRGIKRDRFQNVKFSEFFCSETGRVRFWRARFQTPSSVSFLAILRSAFSLCVTANSPSFSQNSLSLPQNSVNSLLSNSKGNLGHPGHTNPGTGF